MTHRTYTPLHCWVIKHHIQELLEI